MKKEWIPAFGQMTYGIYVLTTTFDDVINGMIASWVTQVSYEPPLIMVAIHPNRYSHKLIEKGHVFGLHVLDRSQKDMLKVFKEPNPEKKFHDLQWKAGKTGVPIIKNCIAWFELKVKECYEPGNHSLYIGEVIDCGFRSAGTALCTMDYDGMYVGKD
jgi:flavin reductase (DIM6/NTAB) family NADH-FMN oxidoreductase RutF